MEPRRGNYRRLFPSRLSHHHQAVHTVSGLRLLYFIFPCYSKTAIHRTLYPRSNLAKDCIQDFSEVSRASRSEFVARVVATRILDRSLVRASFGNGVGLFALGFSSFRLRQIRRLDFGLPVVWSN
jgi:hypothetical protein